MAWWGSLVAVGLTIGVQSQRWVQALPLVALCGALGLDLLRRLAVWTLRLPGAAGRAAVVAATVAIMAAGAAFVFREANTMTVWSDPNAVVADHLAETLADAADGTVVYTAFAPRMSFGSHPTLPFLADHVVGVDLIDPLTAVSDVPDVAGPTAFVFLPERTAELDIVRAAHPGGVTTVATSRGIELYVSYWVPAG